MPKKGRPVTQCQHCRVERKKRSAHVKCDCGEKPNTKEKCVHLQLQDGRHHDGSHTELEVLPEDQEFDDTHCCCHLGSKCTCSSMKKEGSDDSSDAASAAVPSHPRTKPRMTSVQSEGHLTVFANGHHKPCHRNNNAAHESGLPYKIPRSHTDHGHPNAARRSVDSIASVQSHVSAPWQSYNDATSSDGSDHATPPSMLPMGQISPAAYPAMSHQGHFPFSTGMTYQQSLPTSAPVLQDTTGLSLTPSDTLLDAANAWPMAMSDEGTGQTAEDMWNNIDWSTANTTEMNQPALTHTSSATLSEADDIPFIDDSMLAQPYPENSMDTSMSIYPEQLDILTTSYENLDAMLETDQSNRWSLPTTRWDTGSEAGTQSIRQAATFPMDRNSMPPPRPSNMQPAYPAVDFGQYNVQELQSFGQRQSPSSSTSAKPRPKPMYQKQSTLPGGSEWERLIQQYNPSNMDLFSDFEVTQGPNFTDGFENGGISSGQSMTPDMSSMSGNFAPPFGTQQMRPTSLRPTTSNQEFFSGVNMSMSEPYSKPSGNPQWAS